MKTFQERQVEAQAIMAELGEDKQNSTHPGIVRFAEILNDFVRDGTGASGYLAINSSKRRIMYALFPEADRPSWVKTMSSPQGPLA